jgi:hypothetical protein
MTYRACKSLIDRKTYVSVEDMQTKLDIFLLNNRLTQTEYNELTTALNAA